jgi:hypothetical protein
MSAPHKIFELRTSKDAPYSPESAVQLFASLPKLKNNIFFKILRKDETISFEIIVENQTIYFQIYVPVRLISYVKSILVSSYPQIVIKEIEHDILDNLNDLNTTFGNLYLNQAQPLSLKTYQDFSDVDSLSPMLSTLSKLDEHEKAMLQFVVSKANGKTLTFTSMNKAEDSESPVMSSGKSADLKATARIVIASPDQTRNKNLLENLASAYQSLSKPSGNSLGLKKTKLFSKSFLKHMKARNYKAGAKFYLSFEEMATLIHLPNEKLASIPNIAWGKNLLGEPPEDLPVVSKDMDQSLKQHINVFAKTEYKNKEVIYGIKREDRRRHLYVIGKTGTGKSTLLANMAINDLKNDEGLCVIDPHGDLVETLLNYIPKRRINDVIYFDPTDTKRTVKLNLFDDENIAHRELIASGIVSVFKKLYEYSWGPRLEYILRNALLTLLKTDQARLSDVLDLLTNPKFRAGIVENLDDPILKSFWLNEYDKMQERQRTESIASILNKVGQFVSSPLVRNIVNARKSSFSIEQAMSEGKIILVNLSQGKLGEDNATLLGSMLITKIQLAAMGRVNRPEEERKDFYLYVDEFQNFATESFSKILSEARKYRLNLILANQYIAQIPEEVQKAIFGNCGSMASFVMGADDAGVFQKEFGNQYTQDDLVSLGRYQIINKLSIDNIVSKPFPAITLPLATSSNQGKEKVIQVSRERYGKV